MDNYKKLMGITIGTAFGTLIVTSVLITALTKLRRAAYLKSDRNVNEAKFNSDHNVKEQLLDEPAVPKE